MKSTLHGTLPNHQQNGQTASLKTQDASAHARQRANWFRRFAQNSAEFVGCSSCFFVAVLLIVAWAATGPIFHFSDTWQLVINTATTIITFLMVFLIQNTQNRDAKAIHLKLDELIHSVKGARNRLVSLENLSDEELDKLQKDFERLRERATKKDSRRQETPVQNSESA